MSAYVGTDTLALAKRRKLIMAMLIEGEFGRVSMAEAERAYILFLRNRIVNYRPPYQSTLDTEMKEMRAIVQDIINTTD
jgi:hypothetical protein